MALRSGMIAILASLYASAAFAGQEDHDPFDRSGFYVGVGASLQYNVFESQIEDAITDEITTGDLVIGSLDIDESFGVNATIGYRVASFFALELEYEWIDRYDIGADGQFTIGDLGSISDSGTLYSIEGHTLTANTRWILPIWRIQPYLLIGGGFSLSDVEHGDLYDTYSPLLVAEGIDIDEGDSLVAAGRAGIGFDWYLTESLVLNTEAGVVITTLSSPDIDDIEDLNYLSFQAGLQYRF
jgi:opacity protein-like surface antigen